MLRVRANIKQLVGGAGEENNSGPVLAKDRSSSIGSSESHKTVPKIQILFPKLVLRKGLDAGTAFRNSFPLI